MQPSNAMILVSYEALLDELSAHYSLPVVVCHILLLLMKFLTHPSKLTLPRLPECTSSDYMFSKISAASPPPLSTLLY